MLIWPFRRSAAETDAERLLEAVVAASRSPAFFGENRAPDTLEGRFEIVALHAALALIRLRGAPASGNLSQLFTDKLFRWLDAGLREAGVGDLTVPKRMRRLAGDFYGRLDAYAGALAAADNDELQRAVGRNALADEGHPFAVKLAAWAREVQCTQASAPPDAMMEVKGWNSPTG